MTDSYKPVLVDAGCGKVTYLQIDPKTTAYEAITHASCILAGLDDLLCAAAEGSPMKGDGLYALALLSEQAKAFIDAATPMFRVGDIRREGDQP
ncbi:hypothetical protein D3C84_743180 [compost metagenome]